MECIQVRSRLRLEVCRNNNWTSVEVGYWYPGWLCANPSLVEGRRSCLLVENKLIIAGVMLALLVNTLKTLKWNDHREMFVSVNGVSPFLIITEVGWLSEDCKWAVARLLCPETTTTIQQLNGSVRFVHRPYGLWPAFALGSPCGLRLSVSLCGLGVWFVRLSSFG